MSYKCSVLPCNAMQTSTLLTVNGEASLSGPCKRCALYNAEVGLHT